LTTVSVVIITQNEAANIRDCLESVTWADEVVVLDSGSSDGTVDICREYTDHVHSSPNWPGFGVQKNRALALASGEWILVLDADERVTPKLRQEIAEVLARSAGPRVYEVPRLSYYCGRAMRHSGWWPDRVARLFRRGAARFSDATVHERLCFVGRPGRLHNHLEHFSYRGLEQVLEKVNRYSTAGALMLFERGRSGSLSAAVLHGLWAFIRTYIVYRGFLDGKEGFMLSVSNAEGTYYRYLKRMYLSLPHR
jgi:glycosyltransferase involved in cell wall biosynthesis